MNQFRDQLTRVLLASCFFGLAGRAPARAAGEATVGVPQPVFTADEGDDVRRQNFEVLARSEPAYEQLRRILELEARSTGIDDAMRIKEQGLGFVETVRDFEYLCSLRPSNAGSDYQQALGRFIVRHLGRFLRPGDDLGVVPRLEKRSYSVDLAIQIKEVGLNSCRNAADLEQLSRYGFDNASTSYQHAVGRFIGRCASRCFQPGDSFDTILILEGRSFFTEEAMKVKLAGLVAVRSIEDYESLMRKAWSNPSDSYRTERYNFIARHIERGVFDDSNLDTLLRLERESYLVTNAMAVKLAGLRATHNLQQFLDLTRPAWSPASREYNDALSKFIAAHGSRFGM